MNRTAAPGAVFAARTERLNALTGLRWWAAFLVFLFHMRVFATLPAPISSLFDQGYFGVTFFFVLSGFVLTWSMRPGLPTSTFYWRRFARIWPAHIVALLFAIPVFYSIATIPDGSFLKPFDPAVLSLSVFLLQGWSADPLIIFSGNPAAWTLTVEVLFYALHPWIAKILVRVSSRGALLLAFAALLWAFLYRAGMLLWPDGLWGTLPMPVTRVPEFLLGMALAWALRSGWRPRIRPMLGVGAMGLVVVGIMLGTRIGALRLVSQFGNELFTVACAIAILALAVWKLQGRNSWFEARWQVKLGEWSFSFYLVHATVIYLALRVFGYQEPSWGNLWWMALILLTDLVLAWALFSFVERPLEKRMRSWRDSKDLNRQKYTQVS